MKRPLLPFLSLLFLFSCTPEEPSTPPLQPQDFEDRSMEVEVETGTPAHPRPPQYVSSPPVPEVVTFAGDTIPLHRHDVREALEYELVVNTFFHSHTMTILKEVERWRPLIEKTLHDNLVPVDFLYLAVAESELDNNAVSFAGAMGMWQFMKSTAEEYDLEVDRSVDMRRDPKLATEAATKYLREAYVEFNDWPLVAASYNRGMRGIKELLEEQQVDNFFDLHLNKETARYVYRIIALKLILENPEAYGYFLKPEEKYKPYTFTTIVVDEDIDNLVDFAKRHHTTYKELRILNPWFNNTSKYELEIPRNKAYELRLPLVMADSLQE
ncbi:lytic transglycosylase domain-containing protein [Nafulsella turpanensis]|uniref:lytic transglycosylase domain-containing protein n=1 Tax=Nafulsella turpanensis TaxID=1265690 RepID=UPI00034B3044|nr:lytic transglycosylase domain-containing protein [Nafulsella turpanensis]